MCGCQSLSLALFLQQVNSLFLYIIIYYIYLVLVVVGEFSLPLSLTVFLPYPPPSSPFTPSLPFSPPPPLSPCKQVKTKRPFFVLKWDSTGCLMVRFAPFAADRKYFVVVYLGAVCLFTTTAKLILVSRTQLSRNHRGGKTGFGFQFDGMPKVVSLALLFSEIRSAK